MEQIGYIYKITSPSGKIYIGQTKNLKHRIYCYKKLHCKSQPKIFNSIKKYGWENMIFEVIDQSLVIEDKKELNEIEKYWIKFYDSHHNGLNCNDGGYGHLGRKQTPEHIAKRVKFLKLKGRGLGIKKIKQTNQTIEKRKNKLYKKIKQLDMNGNIIKEWASRKEAIEIGHYSGKHISAVCKKIKNSYKNYKWEY